MQALVLNLQSVVWLILMLATGLSWWLGTGHGFATGDGETWRATVTMLILAFFKVRLVIMHFMEVREAPLPLRLVMEGWVFGVCGVVLALYLWGAVAVRAV